MTNEQFKAVIEMIIKIIESSKDTKEAVEKIREVLKAPPHKRPPNGSAPNLLASFCHLAQNSLEIRQYSFARFVQPDEKSDCASLALPLCGTALSNSERGGGRKPKPSPPPFPFTLSLKGSSKNDSAGKV